MMIDLCYNPSPGKPIFLKEILVSQYYPQPSGPFYPPENVPEDDYYDEADYEYEDEDYPRAGDSLLQRLLLVGAGGCLVFLCMSCCGLLGVGLWILDPGSSLVATAIPGSDIGLSFEEPARPDESVVNEQNVKLTILEVNRNAALPDVPPAEGQELIIVTVELVNLGDEEVSFNERDFMLSNHTDYAPIRTTIDGALGRGSLPAGTGLEGRLVFQVTADEFELTLAWDGGPDSEPRYILLE